MEEVLEQYGLTISGVNHATLLASCSGQGFPGPDMVDPKLGIAEPTYLKLLCFVQLSGSSVSAIHVQLLSGGKFSWQAVG